MKQILKQRKCHEVLYWPETDYEEMIQVIGSHSCWPDNPKEVWSQLECIRHDSIAVTVHDSSVLDYQEKLQCQHHHSFVLRLQNKHCHDKSNLQPQWHKTCMLPRQFMTILHLFGVQLNPTKWSKLDPSDCSHCRPSVVHHKGYLLEALAKSKE